MLNNFRDAFRDKLGMKKEQTNSIKFSYFYLDEIRSEESSYTIRWQDTNRVEVIGQQYIRLPPSQSLEINKTYTIVIDGKKRCGTVLAHGNINQFIVHF